LLDRQICYDVVVYQKSDDPFRPPPGDKAKVDPSCAKSQMTRLGHLPVIKRKALQKFEWVDLRRTTVQVRIFKRGFKGLLQWS